MDEHTLSDQLSQVIMLLEQQNEILTRLVPQAVPMSELRRRRIELSVTVAQLAKRVGCTGTFIRMLERGDRDASPEMREAIESAFADAAQGRFFDALPEQPLPLPGLAQAG